MKALTTELTCIVLVNGHESVCEFTVFEYAIHISIESQEKQIAVFLCQRNVKVSQGNVQLDRIQISFSTLVQHSKCINQVKVFS